MRICAHIKRIYAHVKTRRKKSMTPDDRTQASERVSESEWLRSYPSHLAQTWTLASGESLWVRPVRHDDDALEEAFVRGLSAESGYRRMLSGGIKVTPEWINSMTHIDYRYHMAFAVTKFTCGIEQFIGVGRYVIEPATQSADVAVVVAGPGAGTPAARDSARARADGRGARGGGPSTRHQRSDAAARALHGFCRQRGAWRQHRVAHQKRPGPSNTLTKGHFHEIARRCVVPSRSHRDRNL